MFLYVAPIVIITLLAFVAFAMERDDMTARMAIVMALVLSMSALQFM